MEARNLNNKIDPDTKIGHIHLTVGDLKRSIFFYHDILGFKIKNYLGDSAVFLSSGNYHHHIALNTWAGPTAMAAPPGHTGLYHFAILYPGKKQLGKAIRSLQNAEHPISGASDHGVSVCIYTTDPDGNGIELTIDKPEKEWPKDRNGNLQIYTSPLDINILLKDLEH